MTHIAFDLQKAANLWEAFMASFRTGPRYAIPFTDGKTLHLGTIELIVALWLLALGIIAVATVLSIMKRRA